MPIFDMVWMADGIEACGLAGSAESLDLISTQVSRRMPSTICERRTVMRAEKGARDFLAGEM